MNRWDQLCVEGRETDAAILSFLCNWATDTHTHIHTHTHTRTYTHTHIHTHATQATPLPSVTVHPSSLWLLHRLSNCIPKRVCVCVCVFTCV